MWDRPLYDPFTPDTGISSKAPLAAATQKGIQLEFFDLIFNTERWLIRCRTDMKKLILSVIRLGANRKCCRLTIMKKFILSVILNGILVPSVAVSQPQDVLPPFLHDVPVLIKIPLIDGTTNYGTGFYMVESTNAFLVTAAHCIFRSLDPKDMTPINGILELLSYGGDENARLPNSLVINLFQYQAEGRIKRHPTHDVAVVHVGNVVDADYSKSPFTKVVWSVIRMEELSTPFACRTNLCTLFSNVADGSQTITLGYPAELLKPDAIQLQSWTKAWAEADMDFDYPLIRPGSISQKNLSKGKLILNSDVYGGNSGGPVLIVQHPFLNATEYKVVGIVTKFVPVLTRVEPTIPLTNSVAVYSGYSVAEPIDYAIELILQFDTTNNTSKAPSP